MSGRPSRKSAGIGLFRPFSPLFWLFQRVRRAPWKSRKSRKRPFSSDIWDLRKPPSLKPPHLLLREPPPIFDINCPTRENLNGHRYMATGKWPKKDQQNEPRSFLHFCACFRLFSTIFALFSLVFELFKLSVADRFCPSVFALFRTIRLLLFNGCHVDSPNPHQPQNTKCPKCPPPGLVLLNFRLSKNYAADVWLASDFVFSKGWCPCCVGAVSVRDSVNRGA